ncbi:MAG: molecular chaperone TorD family protein [Campylobacteraceae bacterium]|nr:molecular chaperone TorD family protein [Campylobacteraceae bacterium]
MKRVDIFDLSADIFLYPDENWFKKLELLNGLVGNKITIPSQTLDEAREIYINYFEHNSSKFGIVPVASYWIDGRMMSNTSVEVKNFYESCGFENQDFGPPDYISKMLSFCAILLENGKTSEFAKFKEWLYWLDDFSKALEKSVPIKCFAEISQICYLLIRENEV